MSGITAERERLLNEAIDLVIRLQNDPANPVALEMIRAWRARGADHEEIWAQVAKVHGASGLILTEQRRIERRKSLAPSRRTFLFAGLAGLTAGAAAYTFVPEMLRRAQADFLTAKGEIRRIDLPDGSAVTLGPDSAIALAFTAGQRSIELLAGMAFFEVAPDPSRPFAVTSEGLSATALGTAFEVSNDAGMLTVSVEHGRVGVEMPQPQGKDGLQLEGGQWVTFDPGSGSMEQGQRENDQVASWRSNLIFAERESVDALVARIGRWIPGRVVIADPFIGDLRVSGVFDLTDPRLALEAVVHPAGARVRQVSSFMKVISPL